MCFGCVSGGFFEISGVRITNYRFIWSFFGISGYFGVSGSQARISFWRGKRAKKDDFHRSMLVYRISINGHNLTCFGCVFGLFSRFRVLAQNPSFEVKNSIISCFEGSRMRFRGPKLAWRGKRAKKDDFHRSMLVYRISINGHNLTCFGCVSGVFSVFRVTFSRFEACFRVLEEVPMTSSTFTKYHRLDRFEAGNCDYYLISVPR